MFFSIKRPKSKRFYQLTFEGFDVKGRNKFEKALFSLGAFLKAILVYLLSKIRELLRLGVWIVRTSISVVNGTKELITRKLIWSRGRLGRPIATAVVMFVAFVIFLFGEVFNSSKFVNSQEISSDYLSYTSDILPQKNVALTEIPESRKRAESFVYTVQSGDTLSSIGNKFKISVDALRYVNNMSNTEFLKVAQELTIPPVSGLIHKVESGDTLSSIADKYEVAPQAVADFNYILDTSTLAVGTELVIPDAKIPQPVVVYTPSSTGALVPQYAPTAGSGFCVWPSTVRIITQYFTWYHNGIDVATPWNRGMPPLFACTSGTVSRAGWDPWGLGLHVRIDHGNGYETVYGHMSRIDVGYGQRVSKGQSIGLMGNTGRSTGPHVHYMVIFNGVPQNPMNYF